MPCLVLPAINPHPKLFLIDEGTMQQGAMLMPLP